MLIHALPPNMPVELMGPMLQGPTEIKALQVALKNLSIATQRADIDPGPADGEVNNQTVQSVIAAQTLLSSQLSSWEFISLQAALAVGSMTTQAKSAVAAAAPALTVAANTAAVKYRTAGPMMPSPFGSFFGPGWYFTPMGMLLIAATAFVGWKLFFAAPTTK